MTIGLLSVGSVEELALFAAEASIREHFDCDVLRLPAVPEPPHAFDEKRGQYSAVEFMRALIAMPMQQCVRLFAVTERDLCIPMLSFVFGQAQLGGTVAIVSLARLRQEFHGLAAHSPLLAARLEKETVHELGHTFGLVHCLEPACPMSLSTTLHHLDIKGNVLCPSCTIRIHEHLALVRVRGVHALRAERSA